MNHLGLVVIYVSVTQLLHSLRVVLISAWPKNTISPIGGVDPVEQAFLNKRYFRELKLFYFGILFFCEPFFWTHFSPLILELGVALGFRPLFCRVLVYDAAVLFALHAGRCRDGGCFLQAQPERHSVRTPGFHDPDIDRVRALPER